MERLASCSCSNVKLKVTGDPQDCWVCHCDYCQRTTGSIGIFATVYRDEDIISIEGDMTTFDDLPKWPGAARYFCSKCGTTVYWVNPASFPNKKLISLGCFADRDFPGPTRAMQTQYRHPWCGEFDGAQSYQAYPE